MRDFSRCVCVPCGVAVFAARCTISSVTSGSATHWDGSPLVKRPGDDRPGSGAAVTGLRAMAAELIRRVMTTAPVRESWNVIATDGPVGGRYDR